MAQLPYVYVDQGIALAQLQQVVPGAGSVAPASPIRLATITWDSMYKDDLDAAMLSFGWSYLYQGTAPTGVALAQIVPASLAADGSSIGVGSGWSDVTGLNCAVTTRGGSSVGLQATLLASKAVGTAQARVLLNGGAFPANTVVGAAAYEIPGGAEGALAFQPPRTLLPATGSDTTYTFKVQMRSVGALSSITPLAFCAMTAIEYRIP